MALIAVGVLWPLVFRPGAEASDASDPVVFSNYDADFTVSEDGRLDAVETITGEFPSGRHGIFKYWEVDNQNNSGVRQTPEVTSILLDGEPVPYQMLWEGGERFRVAKIGDPDQHLSPGTARVRDPLHHRRRAGPRNHRRGQDDSPIRPATPNSPSVVLLERHRARRGTTGSSAPTSRSRMPGESAGAQCSVGFGVGPPAAT